MDHITIQDKSQVPTPQQMEHQHAAAIPQIEVVNEIQIVVNKKDNQHSLNVTAPSDNNKDARKCIGSRSSKTDLTITTPSTAQIESKSVTIKNGRRKSSEKSEKSESNSGICVCSKLLKHVKGLLQTKAADKASSEYLKYIVDPVHGMELSTNETE